MIGLFLRRRRKPKPRKLRLTTDPTRIPTPPRTTQPRGWHTDERLS